MSRARLILLSATAVMAALFILALVGAEGSGYEHGADPLDVVVTGMWLMEDELPIYEPSRRPSTLRGGGRAVGGAGDGFHSGFGRAGAGHGISGRSGFRGGGLGRGK
jgi:hypothetical protein